MGDPTRQELFEAEVRAEMARLRYQYGGTKNFAAKAELWWAKHFNRQAYAVMKAAWYRIEDESE